MADRGDGREMSEALAAHHIDEDLARAKPTPPDPESYDGFRIQELWVYVAVGEDGDEGVLAGEVGPFPMLPFVAADKRRVDQLRPHAEALAKEFGAEVALVRFGQREVVETNILGGKGEA